MTSKKVKRLFQEIYSSTIPQLSYQSASFFSSACKIAKYSLNTSCKHTNPFMHLYGVALAHMQSTHFSKYQIIPVSSLRYEYPSMQLWFLSSSTDALFFLINETSPDAPITGLIAVICREPHSYHNLRHKSHWRYTSAKRATIGSVQFCWFNASPPPRRCKIRINQSTIHGYSFRVSGDDKKRKTIKVIVIMKRNGQSHNSLCYVLHVYGHGPPTQADTHSRETFKLQT